MFRRPEGGLTLGEGGGRARREEPAEMGAIFPLNGVTIARL